MAMGTLLAVAAYEAYWLYGLYHTQRQALVTQISSLLTEAEANEFREQFNKSLSTDSTAVYLSSFTSRPAVITISKDTLSGKPKEISVHRLNDAPKEVKRFVAGDFDIRRVDEFFTQSLDSIGLSLPHYLRFLRDSTAIDSVGTAGYHPAGNAPIIPPRYLRVTLAVAHRIHPPGHVGHVGRVGRHLAAGHCRLRIHRQSPAATTGLGADEKRFYRQHYP